MARSPPGRPRSASTTCSAPSRSGAGAEGWTHSETSRYPCAPCLLPGSTAQRRSGDHASPPRSSPPEQERDPRREIASRTRAEAARNPTASGPVRSGNRASVAGSRAPSRPNVSSGANSRPNAKTVKMTGQVHRRALAAQYGQVGEGAGCDQHGEGRADHEGCVGPPGRAQRVTQQAQLRQDEEPSQTIPPRRRPASQPGR